MKKLKIQFKSKKKLIPKIIIPTTLRKIIIKPKLGKWCQYYEGRIPYPIECQWNKVPPLCIAKPNCRYCKRDIKWDDWKSGKWEIISQNVQKGENLTDMESPFIEMEDEEIIDNML